MNDHIVLVGGVLLLLSLSPSTLTANTHSLHTRPLHPLTTTRPLQVGINEARYKSLFSLLDLSKNKEFFFSYTYDLTHTLQHNVQASRAASRAASRRQSRSTGTTGTGS